MQLSFVQVKKKQIISPPPPKKIKNKTYIVIPLEAPKLITHSPST